LQGAETMKRILVWFLITIVCASTLDARAPSSERSEETLRVLFIGNSFTFMNDLPGLTERLAASAHPPRKLQTELVGEGGATLKRHWATGRALEAIRRGNWDYVVLQDQGRLGLMRISDDMPQINDPEMFHAYARQFDAEIRKAGATTLFFLTWAPQDAPESQALLNSAYAAIAEELGALVAPVGIAWQKAIELNPKLVLHDHDGSHPGPAGSYLAACVFHSVLFSDTPVGSFRGDLSEEDAAFLQRIGWETGREPKAAIAAAESRAIDAPIPKAPAPVVEAATLDALERGRAILAAAQKGAGGLARLRDLRDVSMRFTGKLFTPGGEIALEGSEIFVFPDVLRSEQQLPFGRAVNFFDGVGGWRKGMQGVEDFSDPMKKVFRGQVVRNTLNLLRAVGDFSVVFEEQAKVGETASDVIVITREGESVRLYIEPASGMLLKKAYRGVGMGGLADIEEIYSDHREVFGIRLPFRVEILQNGTRFMEATMTEIEFDSGVDPAELARKPE
jgi:hypothetical protein